MKKSLILAFVLLFVVFGFAAVPANAAGKTLVAYFSWGGTTRAVAKTVADVLGAELFEIKTVKPYTQNYDEVLDVAKAEQNRSARPELSTHAENMGQYDTIFLGYPCWWGTLPMPVFTFLEEYDFSGKRVIPFTTHGGSGFGRSLGDLKRVLPGAKLENKGLSLQGTGSRSQIAQWLKGLGFTVKE